MDHADGCPVAGWSELGAREAMRGLLALPQDLLRRVLVWEIANRRRTQVIGAIHRAMDRAHVDRR